MTNWHPTIPAGKGPMYVRLAQQIADDIAAGHLPSGSKLPPQRDLAYDLAITVGTIGRAYALVRERGLVSGEVGRGTYVLGSRQTVEQAGSTSTAIEGPVPARQRQGLRQSRDTQTVSLSEDVGFRETRTLMPAPGMLRFDSSSAPEIGQSDIIRPLLQEITLECPYEIASYTRNVPDSWREAGQRWLARSGWTPDVASIVPTLGAQPGLMAVVTATTNPGDRIVSEELAYSTFSRATALAGRQPLSVARDEHGPIPENLEKLCAQQHPKVIFLMPSLHNPTLSIMPESRRDEIVEIARRYNLWIIEDEVYGALRKTGLSPFAAIAPERTFHISSLSKAVAAGVRGGWISCPSTHTQRLSTTHKMLTGGISFLLAELAARLVLSGAAATLRDNIIQEITARHAIAEQHLKGWQASTAPDSPFLWLQLPEPWLPGTFKAAAAAANVLIDDEDHFKIGRSDKVHHRVRIGYTNPHTRKEVTNGFSTIRQLLNDSSATYDSFE